MQYTAYSSTDFINDPYFQTWVIRPDEQSNDFWNNWLKQHPEKKEVVEQAKSFLLELAFKEDFPSDEQIQQSLASTLSIINTVEEESPTRKSTLFSIGGFKRALRIAAIFIILVTTSSIIYYKYWNTKTFIATQYGEVKEVQLPDGSIAVLNAHSSISYFTHVRNNRPRQVWLDGEAFFKVKHINKNEANVKAAEQFIVITKDLNINVLGTSFNVKKRSSATEVVLATGKVKIDFTDKIQSALIMHPGQMVIYGAKHRPLLRAVDPTAYTTWIDKKLMLHEAPIHEIAQYIEDYYGYKVVFKDSVIASRRMEGTLLLDDFQDVLFVLSSTLNIKIEKQDHTLIFKKK
jgi:transmembrane sensor